MQVSYNLLKEYVDIDISPEELTKKLTINGIVLERDEKVTTEIEKVVKDYNPRERGWYKSAIKTKGPTWSPVYVWASQTNIGISAVLPVYDSIGNELGVVLSSMDDHGHYCICPLREQ